MDDKSFFLGKWQFTNTSGKSWEEVYPEGVTAEIEPSGSQFMISWFDGSETHVLDKLNLSNGILEGPGTDKDGVEWSVTIERDGTSDHLKGDVASMFALAPNGIVEASLAGTWGAEAVHPIEDDEADDRVR